MAYCSKDDVTIAVGGSARLIELTDQESSAVFNQGTLDAAIDEADGWINSYCQKRHNVPFSPVPDVIRRLSAAETKYILMRFLGQITQEEVAAHEQREAWLLNVSKGLATPGIDPPPAKSTSVRAQVVDRDITEDVSRESTKGAFW